MSGCIPQDWLDCALHTNNPQISVTWNTNMFFLFMLCTHHGTLSEEDSFTLAAQEPRKTSSWTQAIVLERRESLTGSGISSKMLINVHSSELVTELEPHPTPGEGQEVQSYHKSRSWRAGNSRRMSLMTITVEKQMFRFLGSRTVDDYFIIFVFDNTGRLAATFFSSFSL